VSQGKYATNTDVPAERSRAEIEQTVRRYGAKKFGYGWNDETAHVMFEMADRRIRFDISLPDRNDKAFTHTPGRGLARDADAAEREWEKASRQRWRALAFVIKAKLEAVAAGITTVEEEFLAHIVLPDGTTVGQWTAPQLKEVYAAGTMPELLPGTGR
jgi:hypothetical protein